MDQRKSPEIRRQYILEQLCECLLSSEEAAQCVVLTGLSGSGKTTTLRHFEEHIKSFDNLLTLRTQVDELNQSSCSTLLDSLLEKICSSYQHLEDVFDDFITACLSKEYSEAISAAVNALANLKSTNVVFIIDDLHKVREDYSDKSDAGWLRLLREFILGSDRQATLPPCVHLYLGSRSPFELHSDECNVLHLFNSWGLQQNRDYTEIEVEYFKDEELEEYFKRYYFEGVPNRDILAYEMCEHLRTTAWPRYGADYLLDPRRRPLVLHRLSLLYQKTRNIGKLKSDFTQPFMLFLSQSLSDPEQDELRATIDGMVHDILWNQGLSETEQNFVDISFHMPSIDLQLAESLAEVQNKRVNVSIDERSLINQGLIVVEHDDGERLRFHDKLREFCFDNKRSEHTLSHLYESTAKIMERKAEAIRRYIIDHGVDIAPEQFLNGKNNLADLVDHTCFAYRRVFEESQLPVDPIIVEAFAEFLMEYARELVDAGRTGEAKHHLLLCHEHLGKDSELQSSIAIELAYCCRKIGQLDEAKDWAIKVTQWSKDTNNADYFEAQALYEIAEILREQDVYSEASQKLGEAYELLWRSSAPEQKKSILQAKIKTSQGYMTGIGGDYGNSKTYYAAAEEILRNENQWDDWGMVQREKAYAELAVGEVPKAIEFYDELGKHPLGMTWANWGHSRILVLKGDYNKAEEILSQCAREWHNIGDRQAESFAHFDLGNVRRLKGNWKPALTSYARSKKIAGRYYRRRGRWADWGIQYTRFLSGPQSGVTRSRFADFLQECKQEEDWERRADFKTRAMFDLCLADVLRCAEQLDEAQELAEDVMKSAKDKDPYLYNYSLVEMGIIDLMLDHDKAVSSFQTALFFFDRLQMPWGLIYSEAGLALAAASASESRKHKSKANRLAAKYQLGEVQKFLDSIERGSWRSWPLNYPLY